LPLDVPKKDYTYWHPAENELKLSKKQVELATRHCGRIRSLSARRRKDAAKTKGKGKGNASQ